MMNFKNAVRTIILGGAVFIAMPAVQASANEAKKSQDVIKQYQLRVDQLNYETTTRYNSEMSQIKSWIDESLILIGKDEIDKVKSLSIKIGVYIDFVEASVKRDKAISKAMETESSLKALKAEYGKLDAQIQQLTAEEDILTKKLEALNNKNK